MGEARAARGSGCNRRRWPPDRGGSWRCALGRGGNPSPTAESQDGSPCPSRGRGNSTRNSSRSGSRTDRTERRWSRSRCARRSDPDGDPAPLCTPHTRRAHSRRRFKRPGAIVRGAGRPATHGMLQTADTVSRPGRCPGHEYTLDALTLGQPGGDQAELRRIVGVNEENLHQTSLAVVCGHRRHDRPDRRAANSPGGESA